MSFNKIILVGNLGKDPELRYTPNGDAVCSFTLATNEKVKGESVSTWFKVTLWRKTAEAAAKYLERGSSVYIEGRLQIEEWTDKDGKNRYTLAVNGTDMQFIGGPSQVSTERSEPAQQTFTGGNDQTQDSIPF